MSNTIIELKVKGKKEQFVAIEEAIRTALFVRNKCLRLWMDVKDINQYDLSAYCKVLAKEFKFANELNSMARQAAAEKAWLSIKRFFDNCKANITGKKDILIASCRTPCRCANATLRGSGSMGIQ